MSWLGHTAAAVTVSAATPDLGPGGNKPGLSSGLLPPASSVTGGHRGHPASLFSVLSSGGFSGPALCSPGQLCPVSEAAVSGEVTRSLQQPPVQDQDRGAEMTLKQDDSNDNIEDTGQWPTGNEHCDKELTSFIQRVPRENLPILLQSQRIMEQEHHHLQEARKQFTRQQPGFCSCQSGGQRTWPHSPPWPAVIR